MARVVAAAALVAAVAAGCGSSAHVPATAAPTTAAGAHARLRVEITAQSHHPVLGHTWTYRVRVTDELTGQTVRCRIHLQFYFNGSPVGEVGVHVVKTGVWKETIPATGPDAFPAASLGQPLVLHATVAATGYLPAAAGWRVSSVKQPATVNSG